MTKNRQILFLLRKLLLHHFIEYFALTAKVMYYWCCCMMIFLLFDIKTSKLIPKMLVISVGKIQISLLFHFINILIRVVLYFRYFCFVFNHKVLTHYIVGYVSITYKIRITILVNNFKQIYSCITKRILNFSKIITLSFFIILQQNYEFYYISYWLKDGAAVSLFKFIYI